MKISGNLLADFTEAVKKFLDRTPDETILNYAYTVKASKKYKDYRKRILFDIFYFTNRLSNFDMSARIYKEGCNDAHIYSAMKKMEEIFPIIKRVVNI